MRKALFSSMLGSLICILIWGHAWAIELPFIDDFDNGDYHSYVDETGNTVNYWVPVKQAYGTSSQLSISESNSTLILTTNDYYGGGIKSAVTNDYNFFSHPISIKVSDLIVGGTGGASDQRLLLRLTPYQNTPYLTRNALEISVSGEGRFQLTATDDSGVSIQLINYLFKLPFVATNFELSLNATQYELKLTWPGGGLFFNGDHGLSGVNWTDNQYPHLPGDSLIMILGSSIAKFTNTTTASIGKIEVNAGSWQLEGCQ